MPAHPSIRPLELWLDRHLDSTLEKDLRYEASWYGPINSILTHVFLLQQQFMIKPQAKLHSVLTNPEVEVQGRVSTDSMDNAVRSRKVGRDSTVEPDFIAVKAGFEYGGDKALAVVEVKNTEDFTALEWHQAIQYAHNISHKNPAPDLKVYLVMGTFTYVLGLPVEGIINPVFDKIPTLPGLKESLELIAARHWEV